MGEFLRKAPIIALKKIKTVKETIVIRKISV